MQVLNTTPFVLMLNPPEVPCSCGEVSILGQTAGVIPTCGLTAGFKP